MRVALIALGFIANFAQAQILATVGNSKITVEEFNRKLDEVRKQSLNPPTPEQFLEDLVRYEVGVQEAERLKLTQDPMVKERFKQVLYNSLLEKELGKKVEAIKVTDPEMKEFYKKNPELRIAHILIQFKQNPSVEAREITRKRALDILEDVKKSKRPFEELAKLYSEDLNTKEMGGDLGFQSRVTLLPQIYDVAANMKEGEIKGLLETNFGFHIIKLVDRRTYDMSDKRQVRAAVFDAKRTKLMTDYFERAKKAYKIEVNREALKSVKN